MSEEKKSGGGNKKTLMIVVIAVVLTAALAGGGAWFFMQKSAAAAAKAAKKGGEHAASEGEADAHGEDAAHEPDAEGGAEDAAHAAPPVFQPLEPIVVNLAGGSEAIMRVAITVQLKTEKDKEKLTAYTPKIQGDLMLLFSGKTQEELLTVEGKLKLIEETKETINTALGAKNPKKGSIKEVSFTEMIIQ